MRTHLNYRLPASATARRPGTAAARCRLLELLAQQSNPADGLAALIGALLNSLRAHYAAAACVLVWTDRQHDTHIIHRTGADPQRARQVESLPAELAAILLAGSSEPLRYRGGPGAGAPIAAALGASAFMAVGLDLGAEQEARLYVTAERRGFTAADLRLLAQVATQQRPLVQATAMAEQAGILAAEQERRRVARDLHDSVTQSAISVQLGLGSLYYALPLPDELLRERVRRLLALADEGVADLRGYLDELRRRDTGDAGLLPALYDLGRRFSETSGIAVEIVAAPEIALPRRLADELYLLVNEALSNVRRHTQATQVTVRLEVQGNALTLSIANDQASAAPPFQPRSISERSAALGGRATVSRRDDDRTVVLVEVPLG